MGLLTVTAEQAEARRQRWKFTRRTRYAPYVPNFEILEKEADSHLQFLLNGITSLHRIDQNDTAYANYFSQLKSYITRFFHRYTKETHVRLINLLYLNLTRPMLHYSIVEDCILTLLPLTTGSRLTRSDIQIPWKPLYDLLHSAVFGKNEKLSSTAVLELAANLKKFFPVGSTLEIWNEIRIHMSYKVGLSNVCLFSQAFLPTNLTAEEHEKYGTREWLKDLWRIYTLDQIGEPFGMFAIPSLMYKIERDCPGWMDWTSYYEHIFTVTMRSLKITVRGRSAGNDSDTTALVYFLVYTYGKKRGCDEYLFKMFDYVAQEMHPDNQSEAASSVQKFLKRFIDGVVTRYRREYIKDHTKGRTPQELKITKEKLKFLVEKLIPLVVPSVFAEECSYEAPSIFSKMALFAPEIVIPKMLNLFYPTISDLTQPNRLIQALSCIAKFVLPLATNTCDVGSIRKENKTINEDGEIEAGSFHPPMSARCHLILIIEQLVPLLDVSHTTRTSQIYPVLSYIFNAILCVDMSSLAKKNTLTAEEKELCRMSAKLPAIIDTLMDKLIEMIDITSSSVPISSTEVVGSLKQSKDSENATSAEESTVDICVSFLMEGLSMATDRKLRNKMAARFRHLILSSSHENINAARIYETIMYYCISLDHSNWTVLYNHISKKLKEGLDEAAINNKNLDNSVLWYIQLAPGLFDVNLDIIHREKDRLIQLISLLLSCQNKRAWKRGAGALMRVLYRLLTTYQKPLSTRHDLLDKTFDEYNPIREWGRLYNHYEMSPTFHVPDQEDVAVANKFLCFLFTHVETLRTPDKMTKDDLEKSLYIIRICYEQIVQQTPRKAFEQIQSKVSALPCLADHAIQNEKYLISFPDGAHIQTRIMETLENLVKYMLEKRSDDVDTIKTIITTVSLIADPSEANKDGGSSAEMVISGMAYLEDPLTLHGFYTQCTSRIDLEYAIGCDKSRPPYNTLQDRVVKLLSKLSINRYEEVRLLAQIKMGNQLNYRGAQHTITKEIAIHLTDNALDEDMLQGVLEALSIFGLGADDQPSIRMQIWSGMLRMKELTRAPALDAYESLSNGILHGITSKTYYLQPNNIKNTPEFVAECEKWYAELPKCAFWMPYKENKGYDNGKKRWDDHITELRRKHIELLSEVKKFCADRSISHSRSEWIKTVLIRCQRKYMDEDTIKLAVKLLLNEKEIMRYKAADEIGHWLKKNKPKRKRKEWKCPQRPSDTPSYGCGIRLDNMCVIYDSKNLPNTEQKWNDTIFLKGNHGAYQFPKALSVVRPLNEGDALERGPPNEKEKHIVDFFKDKKNIDKMIEYICVEKQDGGNATRHSEIVILVKYLLRNFPSVEEIFQNFTGILKKLLKSTKREEQALATDLFEGILKGTRHYSFKTLETMWSWLSPHLKTFIDNLNTECEDLWILNMVSFNVHSDLRRYYWLVETIIQMAQSPTMNSRQMTLRLCSLTASGWRAIEVSNRLVEAAWNLIQKAKLATDRASIAAVLNENSTNEIYNLGNDFKEVPEHLRPFKFENLLEKFLSELEDITLKSSKSKLSTSPPPTGTSPSAKENKKSHKSIFKNMLKIQGQSLAKSPLRKRKRVKSESNLSKSSKVSLKKSKCQESDKHETTPSPNYEEDKENDDMDLGGEPVAVTSSDFVVDEIKDKSLIYLRTLVDTLSLYYVSAIFPFTPTLIKILPILLIFATDEDSGENNDTAMGEMRDKASSVVFDQMALAHVDHKNADPLIDILTQTFSVTGTWRLKVAIFRFVQSTVVSNYLVFSTIQRKERIKKIILLGAEDESIEIRKAAILCLSTLLQRAYIVPEQQMIEHFRRLSQSADPIVSEGGTMGICAIVHSSPPGCHAGLQKLSPLLVLLCQLASSKNYKIKEYCGNCLRAFRADRRDEWAESTEIIGEELATLIENCGAAPYCV